MEFSVKQSVLKNELGFVQGIVEKKNTIPVLSNILIESVGENAIRITGTDLDATIRVGVEAEIKTPGAICIQARRLFEIIRLLPDETISFAKEDNEWVKVKCARSNYRLAGVAKDQFPEVPQNKSTPLKIPSSIFGTFIQYTSFAITNEQSRFTLSGAKFTVMGGVARMVSTDGHRLAFIEGKVTGIKGEVDTLIPKKALSELAKIARENSDAEISFGEDPNHLYFETEGRLLITRKLSGTFPNYEMVLPKNNDKTVTFDAEEMKRAIGRAALMSDERTRSVKLSVRPDEIEITSATAEEGEAVELIFAEYKGEPVEVGFNAAYLTDFLNVVTAGAAQGEQVEKETSGDKVKVKESGKTKIIFEFKDANSQTQMRVAGASDYDFKYVVMPLRI
jgi:DNA polymerase-3 subunit beta